MKKIITILTLVAGTGIFAYVFIDKEENPSLLTSELAEKPKSTDLSLKNRQSLKKSKYVISKQSKSLNTFPEECSSTLTDLSAMTAEEYKELITNKKTFVTFFGEACFEKLKSNATFQELVKNSNCKVLEGHKEEVEGTCLTLMFMLKAYFIADHTGGKALSEMTSQELAANFVKMFFGIDKLNTETFKENLKLVDALYEMHPNDPDVLEAYLGYMMIGKQVTNEDSVSPKIDELMNGAFGESFKVDRLHVLKDVLKNDLISAKQNLDKLSTLYPKEPELAYYQAAYYWKQGNREMANTYLDKAITLGASCSYCTPGLYADTKKRLASAKTKDGKLFSISIGLNFENL
jgi:hypothetical protein